MGFHKDDCILLPEYICDVILHPINQLGLKYRYYSVDDSFSPRWDELEKLINVTDAKINEILINLPNILDEEVPLGFSEKENK